MNKTSLGMQPDLSTKRIICIDTVSSKVVMERRRNRGQHAE